MVQYPNKCSLLPLSTDRRRKLQVSLRRLVEDDVVGDLVRGDAVDVPDRPTLCVPQVVNDGAGGTDPLAHLLDPVLRLDVLELLPQHSGPVIGLEKPPFKEVEDAGVSHLQGFDQVRERFLRLLGHEDLPRLDPPHLVHQGLAVRDLCDPPLVAMAMR